MLTELEKKKIGKHWKNFNKENIKQNNSELKKKTNWKWKKHIRRN